MTDLVRTVSALAAGLTAEERALLLQALAPARPRVAIVGLGCRFPGAAGPEAFWRLLARGGDAVREVPADRWDIARYFAPDPDAPGRMLTRYGAFLDRVDGFDAGFFEISPHEARRMDPQQRLLLEVAWEALEHAGVAPDRLRASNTGVFVGACSHDYDDLQPRPADAHTLTGGLLSVLSGRLSYHLGLQGPSLTVDTACSSSLVALHLACRSLRAGECDLAIVAGVNLILDPEGSVRLSRMRALAPDGRCRAFDARASGYVRGEGVGVLVLRREADALREHDRIWALVRGSAVNHDGRSPSLTAPNGLSQRDVIRRALADADVHPDAVDCIEAHGTGTPLGDPIEAETLRDLFDGPDRATLCALGSVKSNIGHLEAAAGLAGVIKVVLALAHQTIPQHLHFTELSPRISLGDALFVPTAAHPWPRGARERVAGVSSFGISGTNAHVVLSDGPEAPVPADRPGPVVLPLSAKSPAALAALARAWVALLRDPAAPPIAALARTAALRRTHHAHRLAVVGDSHEALARALESAPAPANPTLDAVAQRYTAGAAIAWHELYPDPGTPTAAPTYPWQHERHWFTDLPQKPSPSVDLSQKPAAPVPDDLSRRTPIRIPDDPRTSAPIPDGASRPASAPLPDDTSRRDEPDDLSRRTSAPIAASASRPASAPLPGDPSNRSEPDDLSRRTSAPISGDPSRPMSVPLSGDQGEPGDLSPRTSSPAPVETSRTPPAAPSPPDRAALTILVDTAAHQVLGIAPSLKIPPHQDLRDLGLDSLLAIDLATALSDATGRKIPQSFAWDYPSVAAMTDALAVLLGGPAA